MHWIHFTYSKLYYGSICSSDVSLSEYKFESELLISACKQFRKGGKQEPSLFWTYPSLHSLHYTEWSVRRQLMQSCGH